MHIGGDRRKTLIWVGLKLDNKLDISRKKEIKRKVLQLTTVKNYLILLKIGRKSGKFRKITKKCRNKWQRNSDNSKITNKIDPKIGLNYYVGSLINAELFYSSMTFILIFARFLSNFYQRIYQGLILIRKCYSCERRRKLIVINKWSDNIGNHWKLKTAESTR